MMNKVFKITAVFFLAFSFAVNLSAAENVGVMSEQVYKKLSRAQEALGAQNYSGALANLQAINIGKANDYEKAIIYQTFGFVYAEQGNNAQAVNYFKQCLALNALPAEAQKNMLYSLVGLYADQGDYRNVISIANQWLATGATPTPEILIIIGSAYYELGQYREAIPWINKAIAAKSPAKDSYYSLLISSYFEAKDYSGAQNALRVMISRNENDVKWWRYLAGAYQESGDDLSGLAVLTAARRKGLLTDSKDIMNLVKQNLYLEMPYEGAKLLEKEMARGTIASNKTNLDLLLQAWSDAREFEKSLGTIDKLASLTGSGAYDVTKAQILYERGDWDGVITASESAINRGGAKKPGEPYLLKGMALIEKKDFDAAIPPLEKAKEYGSTRRNAGSWLAFIEEERKLKADLEKANLSEEELEEAAEAEATES